MSGKSDPGFKVRDFNTEDYSALITLWSATGLAQSWRKDDLETIRRTLMNGGKLKVLVDNRDQLIGSSWITHDYRRSWIHHFAIHPDHQGKGLSHLLMMETVAVIDELGFQVKLEVHYQNGKAIQLYEKYGFKVLKDYLVYMKR